MSLRLPDKRYPCILADPAWTYRDKANGYHRGGAVNHYETASLDAIKSIPVADMAAPDCCLFMWATMPLLPEAFEVITAWGFTYKTCAFTWVKVLAERPRFPRMGLGYWTRANAELCLLATRGHPQRAARDVGQVIAEPLREHSRKPDAQYTRIERLLGLEAPGNKLELFARQCWPGWDVWGNETGKFEAAPVAAQKVLL